MILDLILVHFFHFQILGGIKMLLFLDCTAVHQFILIVLGKDPTQGLDDTTITAEAEYSINFSRSERKICLSLHYNGSKSFLFVNATKIYQLQAKNSEIKPYILCSGNISKDFAATNMKKMY